MEGGAGERIVEREPQVHELHHRGRQIEDRAVQVVDVQVRADRVRDEALPERPLGDVPGEAAAPVPHVEEDATVGGGADLRADLAVLVQGALGVAVVGVGQDIAGRPCAPGSGRWRSLLSVQESRSKTKMSLDYFGVLFLVLTIGALVFAMVEGTTYGWGSLTNRWQFCNFYCVINPINYH